MSFSPDDLRLAHEQLQSAIKQGSLRRQQQSRQSADKRQRAEAEKEIEYDDRGRKIPKPMFLRPHDIAQGEEYDVERVLFTTLGMGKGEAPRRITRDDILAFQENIALLKDQYTKGITPKNVINLSMQEDIDRSNQQIHLALPLSRKSGIVHFLTNAGPDSKDLNHHVNVEFVNFKSVVFNTAKQTPSTIQNRLAYGNIRFECDCGRHTFWYRYMATIGGYGLGRDEGGFPKVRNPHLSGVACKHVLRVMQYIMSPLGINYLKKEVDKDRKKQLGARSNLTDAQINKALAEQVKDAVDGASKPIQANLRQAEREMVRRAERLAKEQFKKELKALKQASKDIESTVTKEFNAKAIRRLDELLRSEMITQEEYAAFKRGIPNA